MNLYIQVKDGQPYLHPMLEENILQVFPGIDLNNLPSNLARFVRHRQPNPDVLPVGSLEVAECTYQLAEDGQTYQDVWSVRPMTNPEASSATRRQTTENTEHLASSIELANTQINSTTGDIQIAWQNYLSMLNSLVFTDPFTVAWPMVPQVDEEGYLITVTN